MSADEIDAYSLGQSDAYTNVFVAFTTAFADGRDIHWLRERISAQLDVALEPRPGGHV